MLARRTSSSPDVASRLRHRVQLTTDGHNPYLAAVEDSLGGDIDYATLTKLYGNDPEAEKRYSPAKCIGIECKIVLGDPDGKHISTSNVERQNLTLRMSMRRFTRLTNAFSKKVENHAAAVALYFMYYNFARVHQTLRVTPAMEAGASDRRRISASTPGRPGRCLVQVNYQFAMPSQNGVGRDKRRHVSQDGASEPLAEHRAPPSLRIVQLQPASRQLCF